MKNAGKASYDAIPISAGLDDAICKGLKRAEQEKRWAAARKWAASAAAVFCIFFAGANIAPVYAYAAELPVIGAVVRVLHIGQGGTRTDSVRITAGAQGERVDFHFESNAAATAAVPVYSAVHQLAPNRLILTLQGVRTMDNQAILSALLATEAVQDAYLSLIGDDASYGFIIVMKSGYTYEITEYANPASLSVRFYSDESGQNAETVYYLRSEGMPRDEELALMTELFDQEGATQLKTAAGAFIVVVGQYTTEEEANTALQAIEKTHGGKTGLFVASGAADAVPEN